MRSLLLLSTLLLYLPGASGFAQPEEPPPALVVTAPVEEGRVQISLTLVGTAEPRYTVAVANEVDGVVEAVSARKGQAVRRGDPIVRLRALPVELELEGERGRLGEVEARIVKAEADLKRAERLFAATFGSEEELQSAQANLDALRQQARQIRAVIARLEDRLARIVVRAPFAGRVVAERTEVGAWLGEGDPVADLADLSVIHTMVPVPEHRLPQVAIGMGMEVTFDALPGARFTGEVNAIVPRADPASRTFPVQVSIPNPEGRILAGMLARVTFHRAGGESVAMIPKDAFVPQANGGGFVVRVEEGKAAIVPVRILESQDDRFAVVGMNDELIPGDRVVVRGNERLMPGQPVREASTP